MYYLRKIFRILFSRSIFLYIKKVINETNLIDVRNLQLDKTTQIKGCNISGKYCCIGGNSHCYKSDLRGNIQIGKNCRIHKASVSGDLIMRDNSSLWGPNINIYTDNGTKVMIGRYCSVARNVSMQTYNHNYNKITTYFMGSNIFDDTWDNDTISSGDITIGNDVWIGDGCVILGGLRVGDGAVIAAGSVVTKDIEAYSIVGGVPARLIKYRFELDIRDRLKALAWWEWDEKTLLNNKDLFKSELSIATLDRIILD